MAFNTVAGSGAFGLGIVAGGSGGAGMVLTPTGNLATAAHALTEQQKIAQESMEDLLAMLPEEYHNILHGILEARRYQARAALQIAQMQMNAQYQNQLASAAVPPYPPPQYTPNTAPSSTPSTPVGGGGGVGGYIGRLLGGK